MSAAGLGGGGAAADAPHTHAHSLPPNVLVAHLRDGIEAIHLYTGRTVCRLLLQTPELHVDINADGALLKRTSLSLLRLRESVAVAWVWADVRC